MRFQKIFVLFSIIVKSGVNFWVFNCLFHVVAIDGFDDGAQVGFHFGRDEFAKLVIGVPGASDGPSDLVLELGHAIELTRQIAYLYNKNNKNVHINHIIEKKKLPN